MIMLSVSARRGLAVAGLAAVTVTAAGCGSSGGTTATQSSAPSSAATSGAASPSTTPGASTPAAGPSSRSSARSGLAACSTSALSASLDSNQGGGAAGSTYLPIDFTNTSDAGCVLYGYPGVSFVTGPGGTQIGAAATRASGASPVSVTLAAHATAHAWLQVVRGRQLPGVDLPTGHRTLAEGVPAGQHGRVLHRPFVPRMLLGQGDRTDGDAGTLRRGRSGTGPLSTGVLSTFLPSTACRASPSRAPVPRVPFP